jgi:phosphate transport system substrate-binding protein
VRFAFGTMTMMLLLSSIAVDAQDVSTGRHPSARAMMLDEHSMITVTAPLGQYQEQSNLSGTLRSQGSAGTTVLVNRWAEEFTKLYPGVRTEIVGGGIADGLTQLLEGKVDLVPLSRPLSEAERATFQGRFGYPPIEVPVAYDAVAVYVNLRNPLGEISLPHLQAVFARHVTPPSTIPEIWMDLGVRGPLSKKLIARYVLSQGHGTHTLFREQVLAGEDYRFDVTFERVPGGLLNSLAADPASIGFASVMFANDAVRFLPIRVDEQTVSYPSYEEVLKQRYPLARQLCLVVNRPPGKSLPSLTREFLRFALSRNGQRIIALGGNYPITPQLQTNALELIKD